MQTLADEVAAAMQSLDLPAQIHRSGDVAYALHIMQPQLAVEPPPALDAPPLGYDAAMPARVTGERIADAYAGFAEDDRPSIPAILAACLDRIGCPPDEPARRVAMAAAVLASVPSGNAYHNANHTREVVCSAVWLSEANAALAATGAPGAIALHPSDVACLLLLAVMHDIGHDGGSNTVDDSGVRRRVPFRLEDRSLALVQPALRRAGMGEATIAVIRAAIRSTDAAVRPAARMLTDHMLYGAPAPADLPDALAPLGGSAPLALMAALLADADILSSAALTPDYQRAQNARLETEIATLLGCDDVLIFLDTIVGGGLATAAGRLLDENFRRIRSLVEMRCEDVTAPISARGR